MANNWAIGFETHSLTGAITLERREFFGLDRGLFCRICGVSMRTMAFWEHEESKGRSSASQRRIAEILNLLTAVHALLRPDHMTRWLQVPHPQLEGRSPLHTIERGEIGAIWVWLAVAGLQEPNQTV